MTSQELDERIERMLKVYLRDNLENFNIPGNQIDNYLQMHMPGYTKSQVRLIARDCIEAVKNDVTQQKRHHTDERADWCGSIPGVCVCEEIRNTIEANTKELLNGS